MGRRVCCQYCGRVVTVRNMARHLRQSCRVCDPTTVSGERPGRNGRKEFYACATSPGAAYQYTHL